MRRTFRLSGAAAVAAVLTVTAPLSAARAGTDVRVQNDTLRSWRCQVQGQAAPLVGPLERRTLLSVGAGGAEGFVEVLLQAEGGLRVRLRLRSEPRVGWALDQHAVETPGGGRIEVACRGQVERGRRVIELHLREPQAPPAPTREDELQVLAWNVWLRPTTLFGNGQRERVSLIPACVAGYDVIVFSEAFDDDEREVLLRGLAPEYPHATRVVGRDKFLAQDGGVIIVSRWPIEAEAQEVFRAYSGSDGQADKGVLYARIRKQGRPWHLFGTHLQAGPEAAPRKVADRAAQMTQLRAFLEARAIPSDEPVLICGDLNVDLRPGPGGQVGEEMRAALELLRARRLTLTGPLAFTFDERLNPLAEEVREHLDHVLVSGTHAPLEGEVGVRPLRASQPLRFRGDRICYDLSDHFAVAARVRLVPPRRGFSAVVGGERR